MKKKTVFKIFETVLALMVAVLMVVSCGRNGNGTSNPNTQTETETENTGTENEVDSTESAGSTKTESTEIEDIVENTTEEDVVTEEATEIEDSETEEGSSVEDAEEKEDTSVEDTTTSNTNNNSTNTNTNTGANNGSTGAENSTESNNSTTITPVPQTSKEAFDLINAERVKLGLEPAVWDEECERIALIRAQEIYDLGFKISSEAHDGFDKFWWENMDLSECVAWGFDTAEFVVDAWMDSDSHRDILMDKKYTKLAVARCGERWVAVNCHNGIADEV